MILENTERKFIEVFDAMENEERDKVVQGFRDLADLIDQGYPIPCPTEGALKKHLYYFYLDIPTDDF